MKFKVTLKHPTDYGRLQKAPEIFETFRTTTKDAIEEYCQLNFVNRSEILEFTPLVVSKDGPGCYGDGFYERDSFYDKPAVAFKAHTVHPKKLVNSLWRDANNRHLDYLFKITEVTGVCGTPLNPYDTTKWEIEYVELNPRTKQVIKGDFFGIIRPTYMRMNLAEFMRKNYCIEMTQL